MVSYQLLYSFTNYAILYLKSFSLSLLKSLSNDPGMKTLRYESVSLFQQLSDNEYIRRGTIPRDIILYVRSVGVVYVWVELT